MSNVLFNKEVLDPKDQNRLFILGLLGHDYCLAEMKEFNLCDSKQVSNKVTPDACIKQADKLTDCFFRLKSLASNKCPQELNKAEELDSTSLGALKNCVFGVKENK